MSDFGDYFDESDEFDDHGFDDDGFMDDDFYEDPNSFEGLENEDMDTRDNSEKDNFTSRHAFYLGAAMGLAYEEGQKEARRKKLLENKRRVR